MLTTEHGRITVPLPTQADQQTGLAPRPDRTQKKISLGPLDPLGSGIFPTHSLDHKNAATINPKDATSNESFTLLLMRVSMSPKIANQTTNSRSKKHKFSKEAITGRLGGERLSFQAFGLLPPQVRGTKAAKGISGASSAAKAGESLGINRY